MDTPGQNKEKNLEGTSGATGRDGAAQQTKGEQNLFWKMNPKRSKEQHGEGDK